MFNSARANCDGFVVDFETIRLPANRHSDVRPRVLALRSKYKELGRKKEKAKDPVPTAPNPSISAKRPNPGKPISLLSSRRIY